jgi:lipopolysaccharide export system permease protein
VSSFESFFIPSVSNPAKLIREISSPSQMNFVRLAKFIKLQEKTTIHTDNFNGAKVTFHNKFANPIACLLIAMIGAPLGILPRRSSSSWNYIILSIIIFQFYISQSIFNSLAEASRLAPFIAAWLPNFVLFVIAFFIIRKKARTA